MTDQLINTLDRLPALPGAVARVVSMLSGGDYEVEEVHDAIRYDEALATAVLRAANSALYGAPGRTFDLRESMVRLGRANLLKIVLEQQMTEIFDDAGTAYGLRRHAMWRGSVGGALVAEAMARDLGGAEPELAFLSGLMRDIGKLAVDAYLTREGAPLPVAGMRPQATFLEQERAALGHDHAELGCLLARRWGLPEPIALAVRYHHDPPAHEPDHHRLYDIVHAADVICLWTGLGTGYDGLQYRVAPHVRETILNCRDTVEGYMALAWVRISEIESMDPNTGENAA